MSARYVWNCWPKVKYQWMQKTIQLLRGTYAPTLDTNTICGYVSSEVAVGTDPSGVPTVSPAGKIAPVYFARDGLLTPTYMYAFASLGSNYTYGSYSSSETFWHGINYFTEGATDYAAIGVTKSESPGDQSWINFHEYTAKATGGEGSPSLISSDNSSLYPSPSGTIDAKWYKYLGSDTIDPSAISYPTAQLRPGDSLTVTLSPRTPTYGGTISYLYQYRVNGGAWTDIQTTAATSVNFTVPANAKSIQFRARAQDNMGFTSTTYVTGSTVTLERLNLWIGVNDKARKGVELYVGVDGKARKVAAAYIGVNGKARRFL